MRHYLTIIPLICLGFPALAAPALPKPEKAEIVPHKALYDIELVATRSGSQIINIHGKMYYEWKNHCDAWETDHRFALLYEYADSPGMRISSDFTTYEPKDGESFHFNSRRDRDGKTYQQLRGSASKAEVRYTKPDNLAFDMPEGILFPTAHTLKMIEQARAGKKFFSAPVFDGSDEDGAIEINAFIGKPVNAMKIVEPSDKLDMALLNTPAWKARMAVFPVQSGAASADYEMSLVFHDNGVISDMVIDYEDFSVEQKLVALERIKAAPCGE